VGLHSFTQWEKLAVEPVEGQEIGGLENYRLLTRWVEIKKPCLAGFYAGDSGQVF
jgi:hypothetical protein